MEVKTLYTLTYSEQAIKDIAFFKKYGNESLRKKIDKLLKELEEHPSTGTGKVEQLRFDLTGFWSRRINNEHRIVYKIDENNKTVYIYRMKGHYLSFN